MSIQGDIVEDYYIKLIATYRVKLLEIIDILKVEYPKDAKSLLD